MKNYKVVHIYKIISPISNLPYIGYTTEKYVKQHFSKLKSAHKLKRGKNENTPLNYILNLEGRNKIIIIETHYNMFNFRIRNLVDKTISDIDCINRYFEPYKQYFMVVNFNREKYLLERYEYNFNLFMNFYRRKNKLQMRKQLDDYSNDYGLCSTLFLLDDIGLDYKDIYN